MELDFSGYTQATPSDPMDDRGFAGTGSTTQQFDDILDASTQFGDTTGGDSVDFSDFSSAGFAGGAPRSNITNSSSYDPTFAALGQLSRGLDPRDLKGYQDTSFAKQNVDGIMSLRPNSLQQLNKPQVDRITEALRLSGNTDAYKQVSSLRGDDLKNYAAGMDLKNLNLSDFDKMDTQSLANIFSTLGMSEKNPYGISAQGTQTGITGVISNLLGADTNPDFRGSMSSKDIAEKARAGLGFATGSGQLNPNANPRNPMEFGSVSGIANQFGRDASAGATQIKDGLLGLADNVMNFFNKDGKAQAGKTIDDIVTEENKLQGPPLPPSQFDQFGNMVRSSIYDYSGNPTEPLSVIQNRRNQIEDLQQNASRNPMTEPSFMGKKNATINMEKLPLGVNLTQEPTNFMDRGNSLATNQEGIAATSVNQNKDGYDLSEQGIENLKNRMTERAKKYAPGGEFDIELTRRENLPRPPQLVSELQRDIAKRRGLFSLPEASGLDNNVISAGSQNGTPLSNSILQALNEQGFNLDINEEALIDAPRQRPFDGTDEISVRTSDNGLTFANSFNRPFDTRRNTFQDPSGPALTEAQLRATEFDGFTLNPITGQAIYDERGPVQKLKIEDLSKELQGLVSLNTDLDYGDTISVQDLINMSPRGVKESNTALIKEIQNLIKEGREDLDRRLSDEESPTQGLQPLY